jgi:hypothetical protein
MLRVVAVSLYLVACSMTPYYLYISDLYVDSDLNVDLLCDIVVSCDLLHDHPILQIDWPNCTHVGIYDRKFIDKP